MLVAISTSPGSFLLLHANPCKVLLVFNVQQPMSPAGLENPAWLLPVLHGWLRMG